MPIVPKPDSSPARATMSGSSERKPPAVSAADAVSQMETTAARSVWRPSYTAVLTWVP